jgi:tRNA A-37 threonylcarbamoyl transferase component Bud32
MNEAPPAYWIGRLLGRGAVASVHEVTNPQGERFAGKFLHASRDGDLAAAARFAQEAALLQGLEHPNLVRVDGEATGVNERGEERSFVRMELVEGIGLDVLLARKAPLAEGQAIEFSAQLAAGLAYAHAQGIVHRDLKPANVLVANPDGATPQLKIADFGMARASSLSGVDADALTILGTPDYMAPESIDPLAVDSRADLYALGCMLFEMLSATVPYPAATPFGILRRHRDDPLPHLPDSVSSELRALVQSLMAKSPADRPPSAGVVVARLSALGREERGLTPVAERLDSSCARCGQKLVTHVSLCLNCGLPTVVLESGTHAVIITGPGEVGDKMDSELRDSLRAWLGANPQLGLIGGKWLENKIPRMPVVFASQISERSARAMVASLAVLGFESEATASSIYRHPLIRQKARKLAGRVGVIALTSMGGMWHTGGIAVGVLLFGAIGAIIGTTVHSARAVTSRKGDPLPPLSPALRFAFETVEGVAPALEEARHRHALRAVVRQSLDLRACLGPDSVDEELARALLQASTTTSLLAQIDAKLRQRDLNDSDPETRELLHRRDRLAGTMAELSGSLESLRIRSRAAASSRQSHGADADALEALRASVEALEEVQKL